MKNDHPHRQGGQGSGDPGASSSRVAGRPLPVTQPPPLAAAPAWRFTASGCATALPSNEKKPPRCWASPGPAAPGRGSERFVRGAERPCRCDAFRETHHGEPAAPGAESTDH